MWERYHAPVSIEEAMALLSEYRGQARIVAGATDLLLEIERSQRSVEVLIDISRIPGLDEIRYDEEGWIHLGPLVTHSHCANSALIRERAFTLARACWEVGAPQIRSRGTVAGNLITASPANDSIPPLVALGAKVKLSSMGSEREILLESFYKGVRSTAMYNEEILTDISFPSPPAGSMSTFVKLGLRRAQAISVVNVAVKLEMEEERVEQARIALGSVAPMIIRALEAEAHLVNQVLSDEVIERAADLSALSATPIDDLRGSAAYRAKMVRTCTLRALKQLSARKEKEGYPEQPIMLWGPGDYHVHEAAPESYGFTSGTTIETTINGKAYSLAPEAGKSLLRLLREDADLIGTKEGCAEGECGACTIFLDGVAVMSCMVPAPRAHGATIVTIEGLAKDGNLHPVQQAFIDHGAVQCGYCTPGFLMSAAKLLEEQSRPNREEIAEALTGNLCRCTGYYKIVSAVEAAGH